MSKRAPDPGESPFGPARGFIVRPYRRLVGLLGEARVMPPRYEPRGYQDLLGRLILRFYSPASMPTSDEFDAAMEQLRDMLRFEATAPWTTPDACSCLVAAMRRLDAAYREAYEQGLTDIRLADVATEARRASDAAMEQGGDGELW